MEDQFQFDLLIIMIIIIIIIIIIINTYIAQDQTATDLPR